MAVVMGFMISMDLGWKAERGICLVPNRGGGVTWVGQSHSRGPADGRRWRKELWGWGEVIGDDRLAEACCRSGRGRNGGKS